MTRVHPTPTTHTLVVETHVSRRDVERMLAAFDNTPPAGQPMRYGNRSRWPDDGPISHRRPRH